MQIILPNSFIDMGNQRKFKYVLSITGSKEQTVNFFINELNYKKHEIKKVAYDIEYRKQRYQAYKLNKLSIPQVAS